MRKYSLSIFPKGSFLKEWLSYFFHVFTTSAGTLGNKDLDLDKLS